MYLSPLLCFFNKLGPPYLLALAHTLKKFLRYLRRAHPIDKVVLSYRDIMFLEYFIDGSAVPKNFL